MDGKRIDKVLVMSKDPTDVMNVPSEKESQSETKTPRGAGN
jgi:hypothetical protein